MKRTGYLLFLLAVVFFSCTSKTEKVVEETWDDGSPKTVKFYSGDSKKELVKEILYYQNGKKRQEGSYVDGNRDGLWTYWYPNGNKWSQGYYNRGIENGLKTVWHENGQKYYEGRIENEKRTGVWKFWDDKGNLLKEIDYSKR